MVRVRRCRRGLMAYPVSDAHVGRALDVYGEWAEAELELLNALLQPGDVAIDVGANLGTHTVALAQRVGPRGAVLAFEPQRLIHQLLATNATLNGLMNVRAIHGAVGAQAGALVVPDIDYATPGNFGGLSLGAWKDGETVPVFALDALGLTRCRLIKIDVEGMEGAVLDGARQLVATARPFIYFEHNAPTGAPAVLERLLRAEYVCAWHFSPFFRAGNFAGAKDDVFGGMSDANVLAVPAPLAAMIQAFEPVRGVDDTAQAAFERRARR